MVTDNLPAKPKLAVRYHGDVIVTKRLIGKHNTGDVVGGGQPLTPLEDRALTDYWMDKANLYQLKLVAELLGRARQDGRWIACDCQDKNRVPATHPPVLMIRKQENGTIFPYRPTNRPEHTDDCPFRITQEEMRERQERARTANAGIIDPDKLPRLLGEKQVDVQAGTNNGTSNGGEMASERQDSLFSILAWIIERSGINRTQTKVQTIKEQWDAIISMARGTEAGGRLSLYDLLIIGTSKLNNKAYHAPFSAIAKKTPGGLAAVAYALFVADELVRTDSGGTQIKYHYWDYGGSERKRIDCSMDEACEIRFPARDNDAAKAPYLVLIKILADKNGIPRFSRGVAQPIASNKDLFPVDSDQERKTYRKLLGTGSTYMSKGGHYFEIEKPVQGRKTPAGLCRPDFIVRRAINASIEDTLVVETMGFNSAEYCQRKQDTQATMHLICGRLIEDDRSGTNTDEKADDFLYKRTIRWLINGNI